MKALRRRRTRPDVKQALRKAAAVRPLRRRRLAAIASGLVLAGAACVLALALRPARTTPPASPPGDTRWEADHVATTVPLPTGNGWGDLVSAGARAANPERMVWIPAGHFWMGASRENRFPDALPVHEVELDGFWMDATEVTNAQFRRFVAATGHVTTAEKKPDLVEIASQLPPGEPLPPEENRVPGSLVFTPPRGPVPLDDPGRWWRWQPGASWRHPRGPGSTLAGMDDFPVVQVSWEDAAAYAQWAGKRLPTEAEWEYAARGGLDRKRYVWGDQLKPGGRWLANIWQGHFPDDNTREDGFEGTAPVASFPANGYGLYDMAGNVWEWCADWYTPDYYKDSPRKNPQGPQSSYDPLEPRVRHKRVQRGGSFLCSDIYCIRYLPGGRGKGEVKSAASHVGFRCVRSH